MSRSALIIVDGMGIRDTCTGNAITRATMPHLHALMDAHGYAVLQASGPAVGLDEGQVGNSEVGHLTIGAGRLLPPTLSRVRAAFASGEWQAHPAWSALRGAPLLHIAGLLSDAGVHAHWSSLVQTAELAARHGVQAVFVHLFLDGVDSQRGTAPALLAQLQARLSHLRSVHVGTISGRRWACDRSGDRAISAHCRAGLFGEVQRTAYTPERLHDHLRNAPESDFPFHYMDAEGSVRDAEPLILTHHRTDRIRQLAGVLSERVILYSLVQIDGVVPLDRVFFPTRPVHGGLLQVLAEQGIRATRLAEQCKFPHVTHFINGLRDDIPGTAIEIPSIPEAEIRRHPQMSLDALRACVAQRLADPKEQALIVNIPNLDQVGHTGDLRLAEAAAACVDDALHALCNQAARFGWNLVITADHGNADRMLDGDGKPLGSHSANPVPLVVVPAHGARSQLRRRTGSLSHVAATFLATFGLPAPDYMDEALIDAATAVEGSLP